MKNHTFPLLLALAVTVFISALLPVAAIAAPKDDILHVENSRYRAMINGDFAYLDASLADNLLFIHASGRTDTKKSFMDRLKEKGLVYRSIETSDVDVRCYGDCGVVTGSSDLEITAGGTDSSLRLIYTAVYSKIDDRWVLISYQSTHRPQE